MTPPKTGAEQWPRQLAGLERLELTARRRISSPLPGRRTGVTTGAGIDFADFRRYSPGDDFRAVDWALYARLRKLFSRRFQVDSELAVHLLVDVSRSMAYGRVDKLACVKRIARSLGYVGWRRQDRVGLATFSSRLLDSLPPRRARGQLFEIHRRLEGARAAGRTDFVRTCREFGSIVRRGGLAVVLSDFLWAAGYAEGLDFLRYRGLELALIQVLAREELDPRLNGAVELVDAEVPGLGRVRADRSSVAGYRENLRAHQRELQALCMRRAIPLVRLESSCSFAEMTRALLESGIWRAR